ncbi:MAG: T9SS type A sorting domain-containing protein, partial [candidate division Zixibacteria bacterium]|nr:T9SS type A sorting domain-containing protein [candidate division Zixibacteria bacterium]
QPGYVKNFPLRALLFRNGGIDIVCADSIDARGDVNLNGLPYEIADAVMYTLYFIEGLSAFEYPEASIAASDANADGIALSVADLVYLIRVITGDAQPYAKLVSSDMNLSSQVLGNEMTVRYTSGIDAGAALLVFDISGTVGTPRVGNGAAGMDVVSAVNGNELRVLVYNIGSAAITAGIDNVLMTIPVDGSITLRSVEVADFFGATMNVSTRELPSRYDVAQNYPNPFNPTTTIALSLPVAGEYHVAIYNVAGQLIRTFDGSASAGVVQLVWDGKDASGSTVASGMYFYKATVGDFTATKKMLLMK